MSYLGKYKIGESVVIYCNTHSPSTGESTDADGLPEIRIYSGVSATPIVTGSLPLMDSDDTNGFYAKNQAITVASGFGSGNTYLAYIKVYMSGVGGTIAHTFNVVATYENSNVIQWAGTNLAARDTEGYPVVTIKSGTGQGELTASLGRVGIDITNTSEYLTGFDLLDYLKLQHANEYHKIVVTDNGNGTSTAYILNSANNATVVTISYSNSDGSRSANATLEPDNE